MNVESNTSIVSVENVVLQGNPPSISEASKDSVVLRTVTVAPSEVEARGEDSSIVIQHGTEVTATEGAEPEIYIVIPNSDMLDGQPIVLSESFLQSAGHVVRAADIGAVTHVQAVLEKSSAEQQATAEEARPPAVSVPLQGKVVATSGTKRSSAEAALNSIMRNTDIVKPKQEIIIIPDKDTDDPKPSPSKKPKQVKIQGITCKICKNLFDSEKELFMHMELHKKGRPFTCSLCNEGFTEVSSYHAHVKTHAVGKKMYTCEVCKVTMKNYSCFVTHRRTHTGEKPYKCEVCAAGFAHVMTLRSHMQVHAQAKIKKSPE